MTEHKKAFTLRDFVEWVESRDILDMTEDEWEPLEKAGEFIYEGIGEIPESIEKDGVDTPFGKMFLAEEWGGEGQGESAGFIVEIADRFFRHKGFYSSWNGTDWDYHEWEEVLPYKVEVTKYKAKTND